MTETEERPKKKVPKKKGLHGWKAALTVIGCGTFAAFAVFGSLISLLGMVFNVTSSGVDTEDSGEIGAPPEQIGDARSSLAGGEMDVCSDNIDELTTITVTRQDDGANYVDTATGGEIGIPGATRVVQDECLWEIVPRGGSPWEFSFKYEAIIEDDGGETREDIARRIYEDAASSLSEEFSEVSSEGNSSLADSSYHVQGLGSSGHSAYALVVHVKSAVYEIHFEVQEESSSGQVGLEEFQNQARVLTSFLNQGFSYWIPDE